jgi:hypothetical protein
MRDNCLEAFNKFTEILQVKTDDYDRRHRIRYFSLKT